MGRRAMAPKDMGVWMMSMNLRWKLVLMMSVFTAVFCTLMIMDEKVNSKRKKCRMRKDK